MNPFKLKPKNRGLNAEDDSHRARFIGWGVTISLHVLLLLIFAFVSIGWQYDLPEWVEMEFISLNQQPARVATPRPNPAAKLKKNKIDSRKQVIDLPKRRMLEEEPPLLRAERHREFETDENLTEVIKQDYGQRRSESEVPRPKLNLKGKAIAKVENLQTGEKQIQMNTPDLGKGVTVPFLIEGEAAERTVVQRVIPEYPGGLRAEAVVKISFVVLPSGLVARAVPLLKGNPTLEKIAMEAFRQWRFNPLPGDVEQREQQGVITFRFVLK